MGHPPATRPAFVRRPRRPRNGTVEMDGVMLTVSGFSNDPIGLERELRAYFLARRPVSVDPLGNKYPETTTLEVAQVATILYDESRLYVDKRKSSLRDSILFGAVGHIADALGRDDDYAGHADAVRRFTDFYGGLQRDLSRLPPWETYPKNENAWREFGRLVVRLGVAADNPIPAGDYTDAVIDRAKRLPEAAAKAAETVVRAALSPVRAAGWEVAKSLMVPAAIGGGALLVAALVFRAPSDERERAS